MDNAKPRLPQTPNPRINANNGPVWMDRRRKKKYGGNTIQKLKRLPVRLEAIG